MSFYFNRLKRKGVECTGARYVQSRCSYIYHMHYVRNKFKLCDCSRSWKIDVLKTIPKHHKRFWPKTFKRDLLK